MPREGGRRAQSHSENCAGDREGTRAENFAENWADRFRQKHGRAPRVLHIGNTANNAYNNAKLLNQHGLECDVVCYDYYHIMGCAEWEDADFEGEIADQFYPDWSKVDLKGFARPRWFAQGPQVLCLRYLLARRRKQGLAAWWWWKRLAWGSTQARIESRNRNAFALLRATRAFVRKISPLFAGVLLGLLLVFESVDAKRLGALLAFSCGLGVAGAIARKAYSYFRKRSARCDPGVTVAAAAADPFDARVNALVDEFASLFPDRGDKLEAKDLEPYRRRLPLWGELFAEYDVIHAYATDVIYPLLLSRSYVAFEHGTIRDLPFETSPRGRRLAIGFAKANVLYMTNADSIEQGRRLTRLTGRTAPTANVVGVGREHGTEPGTERLIFGLHGMDLERVKERLRACDLAPRTTRRFGVPEELKLFFAPARHHWRHGARIWSKGNDRIIRAADLLLRRSVVGFKMVFVNWGQEVLLSKELISELGVGDHVIWIEPLHKRELIDAYRCSDAVLDQFLLPCIGGVTIEALLVGRAPVLTRLDDAMIREFYGETIPLFNCESPEDIARSLERIVAGGPDIESTIARCRDWMERYHSTRVQLETNQRAYARLTGLEVEERNAA